jgi:hypothetical protein
LPLHQYHAICRPGTAHQIHGDVVIVNDGDFAWYNDSYARQPSRHSEQPSKPPDKIDILKSAIRNQTIIERFSVFATAVAVPELLWQPSPTSLCLNFSRPTPTNDLQKQGATLQAEVAKMRDRMEALTRENRREAAKQTVPDNDPQGFGIESAITQFSARQSSLPAVADADRPVAE